MAIISFALTTDEFLSGRKTVTRRDWAKNHLKRWQKWYDERKRIHTAYDKVPFAGGQEIGRFFLTERPYQEKLADMPLSDLKEEGGMCDSIEEFCELIGKKPDDIVTVIRFVSVASLNPRHKVFVIAPSEDAYYAWLLNHDLPMRGVFRYLPNGCASMQLAGTDNPRVVYLPGAHLRPDFAHIERELWCRSFPTNKR